MSASFEHASFLRLERYRLRELGARDERAVTLHLASCAACRKCLAEVEREIALPELPRAAERSTEPTSSARELIALRDEMARARSRKRMWMGSQLAGALAMAAAALLMVRTLGSPSERAPAERISVKGGDVAIELVRKRGELVVSDARAFADGDAFKVLLTCPPPLSPHFDVVVYQGGQAYFPLEAGALSSCGNRRTLSGAFSLDGPHDALVCIALSEHGAPARSALRRGPEALPELSVCTPVSRQ